MTFTACLSRLSAGLVSLVAASSVLAQPLGPSPYQSFADSPFSGAAFPGYFHLETFEDGALNTPGVTASAGTIVAPSSATDSVDDDDGSIDGSGSGGRSFYSNQSVNTLAFTFDAGSLGALPTHAGIVWTDVGQVIVGDFAFGDVRFRAYAADNSLIDEIGPVTLGDGSFLGQTAEDRFFGIIAPGGILRIEIETTNSVDWEVDHLQYGLVPAPGAAVLAGLATLTGMRRRRPARSC